MQACQLLARLFPLPRHIAARTVHNLSEEGSFLRVNLELLGRRTELRGHLKINTDYNRTHFVRKVLHKLLER